ncbi:P-loop NTPase fold protein [Actinomadura sp. NPDC023710]|uniref:KAP family P-loop NTPase fold protein n=1 Tax=Actinomadura sp. NPDC023710 TaxID=3158219 RepID=UPI0033D8261C
MTNSQMRTDFAAPLFDDNPAVQDLLGFDAVAEVVARIVTAGGLDPVTVGVHSAWGGGKSTALNLIADQLEDAGHVVVVRIDPWELEGAEDLRGTLIAQVLDELQNRIGAVTADTSKRQRLVTRLGGLRRRVAWGRVAQLSVAAAAALSPDLSSLVEVLTPQPGQALNDSDSAADTSDDVDGGFSSGAQGMAGFRAAFEELMREVEGIQKVVVLVDDLDRCLPSTIMATLEAIKLFLSVPQTAFVLAADEELIREAIGIHLEGASRGGLAKLYTEKIIQIPISLPVLSLEQAEAYIALLLCMNAGQLTTMAFRGVVEAARERRLQGRAPYVVSAEVASEGPSDEHLALAARCAVGLGADVWRSPRAIKRFLNALAVREHLARAGGASLELELLLKLYLLEVRYLDEFRLLSQKAAAERDALVVAWEIWARGEGDRPPGVREETRAWAASQPSLVGLQAQIERYLSVAATLLSDVRFGGAVTGALMRIIENLTHASDSTRNAAVQQLDELEPADRQTVVENLGEQVTRLADPEPAIASLSQVGGSYPDLAEPVGRVLKQPAVMRRLEPYHVPLLREFPTVLHAIADADELDGDLVRAAQTELADLQR